MLTLSGCQTLVDHVNSECDSLHLWLLW